MTPEQLGRFLCRLELTGALFVELMNFVESVRAVRIERFGYSDSRRYNHYKSNIWVCWVHDTGEGWCVLANPDFGYSAAIPSKEPISVVDAVVGERLCLAHLRTLGWVVLPET